LHLLRFAYKFLLYRLKSFRLHGIHSPFVFNLYQQVICHNGHFAPYRPIEKLRQKLLRNQRVIEVTDFGAGSKVNATRVRKIAELARISAKPAKYAQLLFRLANYRQPEIILELGTSLGLTTAYLAAARQQARVYTCEGCPTIGQEARQNFKALHLKNIEIITGNLDHILAPLVEKVPQLDFVFFDGNHRYLPTIQYFNICLQKHTEDSIFVFDDIYWSSEMEKAWREICRHPDVTLSLDLFQVGLLFFRKKQPKQHFTLWF
jgi:predicted O-methyltransferase YrrM